MRQDNDTASNYTERACQEILGAAQTERDFGGSLAAVLAAVAAHLGSSDALPAGRPGSWEADHVRLAAHRAGVAKRVGEMIKRGGVLPALTVTASVKPAEAAWPFQGGAR